MFGRTAPSQLPPRPSLGGVIDPPRANANAASSARSRSHACQLGLEASAIGKRRRRRRELPCFVRRSPFQASFPPMPEPLLRVHPLFRDHNSRSRRIQPKTAFSRFPPVHRAALKGQFRVDSGPIARQRSLKPASALPRSEGGASRQTSKFETLHDLLGPDLRHLPSVRAGACHAPSRAPAASLRAQRSGHRSAFVVVTRSRPRDFHWRT